MSQEINEPVDAIINFTSVSSKYGHGEQGDGGPGTMIHLFLN